jgi:LDH2 family malate/lactate/ureidoglycolate dehydrogenase
MDTMDDKEAGRVSREDAERVCIHILEKLGVPSEDAEVIARRLVIADMRGVSSHGVSRLPIYARRLGAGLIEPRPNIKVIRDSPAVVLLDGGNGFGHVVGTRAMEMAIERARVAGIGAVGVRRSTHFGIAGSFALIPARESMIGFVGSNGASRMAAWGGKTALLGTNPLAVAVPTGEDYRYPLLLDMATSAAAVGKVVMATKSGERIPSGWATYQHGHPTRDPAEALEGLMLPVGGPKGYGLALMLDVLCGVLTGAAFGTNVGSMYRDWDRPENVGHFFIAIDVASFMSAEDFEKRIDRLCAEVKASELAPGFDAIYLPGEIEFQREQHHREAGISVAAPVWGEIREVADELNVSVSLPC